MGLHDREYYREPDTTARAVFRNRSMVVTLIAINVAVWILQIIFIDRNARVETNFPESIFGGHPEDIFGRGYLWQLLTANFLHAPRNFLHIVFNMVVLYFFGREVEAIYGKRDFLIFYLSAGIVAMFAESLVAHIAGVNPLILGASGSVLGVLMLYTLMNPTRTVLIWFVFPAPIWLISTVIVIMNLGWALSGGGPGNVAYVAHLGGLAFGALYRFVDLRWSTIRDHYLGGIFSGRTRRSPGRSRARRGGRRPRGKILPFPGMEKASSEVSTRGEKREVDSISERIDQLLEKISRSGQESLTEEEMSFLRENSRNYRSRR